MKQNYYSPPFTVIRHVPLAERNGASCSQIVATTVTASTKPAKTVWGKNHVCTCVIWFERRKGYVITSNPYGIILCLLYTSKYTMYATHVIRTPLPSDFFLNNKAAV